ncbi:hypothetical protein [Azospirillum largimobile]
MKSRAEYEGGRCGLRMIRTGLFWDGPPLMRRRIRAGLVLFLRRPTCRGTVRQGGAVPCEGSR